MKNRTFKTTDIAVLVLGYVGLPLALELSRYFKVLGFDTNKLRINELNKRIDTTNEVSKNIYFKKSNILFTNNFIDCKSCNIFIILYSGKYS